MVKEKINGILNKIKNNKKKIIGITIGVFAVFIFTFVVYNLNNPTKFNRLFANVLNNGKPVNDAFEDNTFYSCVVDAYNSNHQDNKKAYTDNLTDEELASITSLMCGGWSYSDNDRITSAKGIEKLTELTSLNLDSNQLTSIDISGNTSLTNLDLNSNQLTNIDLSKNTSLTNLDLSSNKLTSLDLSQNVNLDHFTIDGNPLIDDILVRVGETYQIEEKIILPEGQNFTYSIDATSVATVEENTIITLVEGNTVLHTVIGNNNSNIASFYRNLVVGEIKLINNASSDILINNDEKVVIETDENHLEDIVNRVTPNIGKVVVDGDTLKIIYKGEEQAYKILYVDLITEGGYYININSIDNIEDDSNIKTKNCTVELSANKDLLTIKYGDVIVYEVKTLSIYLPNDFKPVKVDPDDAYYLINIRSSKLDNSLINNATNINDLDKNKINVINARMKYEKQTYEEDGNEYTEETLRLYPLTEDEAMSNIDILNIYSDNYDINNNYIYLGANKLKNDITIKVNGEEMPKEDMNEFIKFELTDNAFEMWYINKEYGDDSCDVSYCAKIDSWNLIKVSSDKYDMSSDTINLGNEDIDLSKINVTNATLKKEDNKLLIMYGDEVVKEFKLEGGKKTTTTTKKDDEKPTTTKDKTTTKEEVKTTTTKKKASIIDKIFGNKETTTVKKEETITKKNIFRKSTTTKVENSSGNVTSNNKNSFKKLVTGSNLLILFLSITDIALIIYIIIDKNKDEEA